MTREESIQFIDKCIEEIKNLPADKLDEYRRAYDVGTSTDTNDDFVFVMPTIEIGYKIEYSNIIKNDLESYSHTEYKFENNTNINVMNRNIAKAA